MRIYEDKNDTTNYFAIIYTNPNGNKYITVNNAFSSIEEVKKYWDRNEKPNNYNYVQIVPIQNKQAYLYFRYWNAQSKWKFTDKNYDLFRYVFGCDFSIFSYFFKSCVDGLESL